MVSTYELRRGNWVTLDWDGELRELQVDAITDRVWFKEWEDFSESSIYPIQITHEVLLQFGFKLHGNSNEYWSIYYLPDYFSISIWVHYKPIAGFEKKGTCYYGDNYLPLTDMHHLQNLYFVMTQKELTRVFTQQ